MSELTMALRTLLDVVRITELQDAATKPEWK